MMAPIDAGMVTTINRFIAIKGSDNSGDLFKNNKTSATTTSPQ
jgi:hypothetical protein